MPVLAPAQIANLPAGKVVVYRRGIAPVIGRARMAWTRADVRAQRGTPAGDGLARSVAAGPRVGRRRLSGLLRRLRRRFTTRAAPRRRSAPSRPGPRAPLVIDVDPVVEPVLGAEQPEPRPSGTTGQQVACA